MTRRKIKIGDRFGGLTIIDNAAPIFSASNKKYLTFMCLCECGRKEVIRGVYLLTGKYSKCTICKRGKCQVCNAEILKNTFKTVCSQDCYIVYRRKQFSQGCLIKI